MIEIRPLEVSELPIFRAHMERHLEESGAGDTPIFAPYAKNHGLSFDPWEASRALTMHLPLSAPSWLRAWAAWDGPKVIGHVELRSPELKTSLHRALLGMGVEAAHRRRGIGRRLMQVALSWARAEPSIEWVDLSVFAANRPAHALYVDLGFEQIGVQRDRYRVDGTSIDDISMTMRVGRIGRTSAKNC